jgi:hypothetical protein
MASYAQTCGAASELVNCPRVWPWDMSLPLRNCRRRGEIIVSLQGPHVLYLSIILHNYPGLCSCCAILLPNAITRAPENVKTFCV